MKKDENQRRDSRSESDRTVRRDRISRHVLRQAVAAGHLTSEIAKRVVERQADLRDSGESCDLPSVLPDFLSGSALVAVSGLYRQAVEASRSGSKPETTSPPKTGGADATRIRRPRVAASAAAAVVVLTIAIVWLSSGPGDDSTSRSDAARMQVVALLATPPGTVLPDAQSLLMQIASIRGETEIEMLRELAAEGPPRVQLNALRLLTLVGDRTAVAPLTSLSESPDELTRLVALDCASRDHRDRVFPELARALSSERADVRHYAINALGRVARGAENRAIDYLADLTTHPDPKTRALAVRKILALRPSALEDLELGIPLASSAGASRPTTTENSREAALASAPEARRADGADADLTELARRLRTNSRDGSRDDSQNGDVTQPSPTETKAPGSPTSPPTKSTPTPTPAPTPTPTPTPAPTPTPKAIAKKPPTVPAAVSIAKRDGLKLLRQGDAARVLTMVERAMAVAHQEDAMLYRLRGLAHLVQGSLDDALADLQKTIDLAPDLVDAYFDLSTCYGARKQKRSAYATLVMALRFGFRDVAVIRAESRLDLIKDSPAFHALMEHYFHSPLAAEKDDAKRLKLATKRLQAAFRKQKDPFLRALAVVRFPETGGLEATRTIHALIDDRDLTVRRTIAEVLGKTRDPASVEFLCSTATRSRQPERSRQALQWALKMIPGQQSTEAILAGLVDKSIDVQLAAVDAIGEHPDRRAVEPLLTLLDEVEGIERHAIIESLGKITGKDLGLASIDWRNWWNNHGAKVEIGPVRNPCAGPPKSTVSLPSAYSERSGKAKRLALARNGGSRETELAVEHALEWLARHQNKDGRWDTDQWALRCSERDAWNRVTKVRQRVWDVQVSGLALMAFLGAGYTHVGGEYHKTVQKGLDFLLARQRADGYFSGDHHHWRRSHEIATVAITEAYVMTRDCRLREPAERAARWILGRQHLNGGWGWHRQESYTSMTGWNLTALVTALDAGLAVPASSIVAARSYLDSVTLEAAAGQQKAGFAYETLRPAAQVGESLSVEKHDDVRAGGGALSTTVGLWCRMILGQSVLGQSVRDPRVLGALAQLRRALPRVDAKGGLTLDDRLYFGTQAALIQGRAVWKDWNAAMKTALLGSVVKKGCERGSWVPTNDHGRVHATALATLMLESYYRFRPGTRN